MSLSILLPMASYILNRVVVVMGFVNLITHGPGPGVGVKVLLDKSTVGLDRLIHAAMTCDMPSHLPFQAIVISPA